ncbi:hypothetical protein N7G274_004549 [Stereocaulon virgatum]|uniref:Uncharacterized protein n=1 Tax=Stereocaulon virgatum TaxID=373712 RepID=A0ABR4ABB3_9LECA
MLKAWKDKLRDDDPCPVSSRFFKDIITFSFLPFWVIILLKIDTCKRNLRAKHLLNMRFVTFSILSLAALGAAQSSVVSLFLEDPVSIDLVGSIAGSVSNDHLMLHAELTGDMLGLHRNNLRSRL